MFTIVPDIRDSTGNRYKLMEYTGTFTGELNQISVRGLTGISYQIVNEENAIFLVINSQRDPSDGVRWIGNETNNWNYTDNNFSLQGNETEFVAGDGIVIGDDAQKTTITIDELMPVAQRHHHKW